VVGGLFLAFNSQFKIDDFIRVGDAEGFVHRVSLRYTTVVSMDGTTLYVPNSFFLYKPMINFSQRPKRDIDIRVRIARSTPVSVLRECLERLELMLQSLHVGLTSHEESLADLRHGDKRQRFFFVAMEELYEIRVYSYSEELDSRKFAMIKSEVWLAVMEIMEELGIDVLSDSLDHNDRKDEGASSTAPALAPPLSSSGGDQDPFSSQMDMLTGAHTGDGARTQL
jgi:small-conductance mechanosensitive channel